MGYSSNLVKYRVRYGRFKGLEGDGGKMPSGMIAFCHPSIDDPQFTEHFWPKELEALEYVQGKRRHPNRHLYEKGALVNVPYLTRSGPGPYLEGELKNYVEINEGFIRVHVQNQKNLQGSGRPSIRGKITSFSKKSRNRMIQRMASLTQVPNLWIDFTFADDVMSGKSVDDRAIFSSKCIDNLGKFLNKLFPGSWDLWRREYEDRKSGKLQGEECPHFHVLLHIQNLTVKNYVGIALKLLSYWVAMTGTRDPNAMKVAMNPKSYRLIKDRKMAQVYVSKYVAKEEQHPLDDDASLGRFWGSHGKLPVGQPEFEVLSDGEEMLLRRYIRRFVKKQRMKNLVKSDSGFWILIQRHTVRRLIKFIKRQNEDDLTQFWENQAKTAI